jgi:hypothetical protein
MVDMDGGEISIVSQAEILGLNRSTLYRHTPHSQEDAQPEES